MQEQLTIPVRFDRYRTSLQFFTAYFDLLRNLYFEARWEI